MATTKGTKTAKSDSKQCFFITPIGDEASSERRRADWIFNLVVEPACIASKLRPERADKMSASAMIGTNIFRAIYEAPVCVADLTCLNPNVLYEMGVRHTLRKPIIHIAQAGTRLPFDTAAHLTHFYDLETHGSVTALKSLVEEDIARMIQGEYEVSNPFTQALGAIELRESEDPKDRLIADLDERLRAVEIERRTLPDRYRNSNVHNEHYKRTNQYIQHLRGRVDNETMTLSKEFFAERLKDAENSDLLDLYQDIARSNWSQKDDLLDIIRTSRPNLSQYFDLL